MLSGSRKMAVSAEWKNKIYPAIISQFKTPAKVTHNK